ncbi:hypothetical protein E2C01_005113 [Portunus trituberculatus]|uniref:Uncharacterized protein n=1 Tax=Portunus trituberculatus TaxID=210409 RepID=A0A5B7CSG7_PORTR|nr:hypothetical protein [Portunus trituberculatus]
MPCHTLDIPGSSPVVGVGCTQGCGTGSGDASAAASDGRPVKGWVAMSINCNTKETHSKRMKLLLQ